jgi:predicted nucleic acid-binding Zn ribbon protein
MPIHEYACRDCGNQFETLVRSLEEKASVFATRGGSSEPAACGTCGDPRGPGACRLN